MLVGTWLCTDRRISVWQNAHATKAPVLLVGHRNQNDAQSRPQNHGQNGVKSKFHRDSQSQVQVRPVRTYPLLTSPHRHLPQVKRKVGQDKGRAGP